MRLDKPAGIYLFNLPHLLGTFCAACIMYPKGPPREHLDHQSGIPFRHSLGGAACSWNENLDHEYDRQVFC